MGGVAFRAGKGSAKGLRNLGLGSLFFVAAALLSHSPAWSQSRGSSSVITLKGGSLAGTSASPASSSSAVTTAKGGASTDNSAPSKGVVTVGASPSSMSPLAAPGSAPPDIVSTGQDQPRAPINGSTGDFSTSVAIDVPDFHGIEPHLSLAYDSSDRGMDWLGVGWRLEGVSRIERATPHSGAPSFSTSYPLKWRFTLARRSSDA